MAVEDAKELRKAPGAFATGVTVIATVDEDGHFYGLTADPAAAGIAKKADRYRASLSSQIQAGGRARNAVEPINVSEAPGCV